MESNATAKLIQEAIENTTRDETTMAALDQCIEALRSGHDSDEYKNTFGGLSHKEANDVTMDILSKVATIERRNRENNRIAINKFADSTPLYKFKYRALCLGHYVNDAGEFTDENGNPTDGVMIEYKYKDTVNGEEVRYLDLEDIDHKTTFRIYSCNAALIKETVPDNTIN